MVFYRPIPYRMWKGKVAVYGRMHGRRVTFTFLRTRGVRVH